MTPFGPCGCTKRAYVQSVISKHCEIPGVVKGSLISDRCKFGKDNTHV